MDCKNCGNTHPEDRADRCVPFFDVQNTMMHYNWANRRMLIALIAVLVTTAIIVMVFTSNQTKREQMWQETIKSMYSTPDSEVTDGEQKR